MNATNLDRWQRERAALVRELLYSCTLTDRVHQAFTRRIHLLAEKIRKAETREGTNHARAMQD